jgi:hypothetical protein
VRLFSGPPTPTSPTLGTIMNTRRVETYNQGDDPTQVPPQREEVQRWRPRGRYFDPRAAIIKDTPGPLNPRTQHRKHHMTEKHDTRRDPLRLPRCDDVKLIVREDESSELFFRTEANNRKILVPVTNTLLLSLRSILAMHFDPDPDEAHDVGS